jgi:hypothetical protein
MNLKPTQARRYFEARLQGQRIGHGPGITLRCCFHDDRTASLSINLEKGVWKCHAGCGQGGLIDFEQKFSSCDRDTAKANIAELLGEKQIFAFHLKPEAVYQYHDANGCVVFEKVRFPGKRFVQRKPDGNGGYEYRLGNCLKPIYHLPEVLVANEIIICEGEKDADNVRALNLGSREKGVFVAATTNFDGAGKWRDEYSPYLLGKKVIILPDNDEAGRKHAERVARSIYPYALGVKVVALPDVPEKGDVSDYLKTHSADDLIAEIKRVPQWHPEAKDDRVLVPATGFVQSTPSEVDWLVEGVIERGANGFFCAQPKVGKSWAAVDLALSLALGVPWLGFKVPHPSRVALISREDNPSLTGWRMRHLLAGKEGENRPALERNLYVNSRAQTPAFMLDNGEHWEELVEALQRRAIEFAIFDVFNVMHAADENDNTEMRQVLNKLSAIQAAAKCSIGVVHHFNKMEDRSMTQRLRGAGAIAGWAEWLIGIFVQDEEQKIRRMEFELKAACPPDPIFYRVQTGDDGAIRLERTESPAVNIHTQPVAGRRYM